MKKGEITLPLVVKDACYQGSRRAEGTLIQYIGID